MKPGNNIAEPADRHTGRVFLLIFALLAMGIVAAGYFYYRNQEWQFRVEAEHQLSAIADLKVGELTQWRKERLGDGGLLFKNVLISDLVRRFLEKPEDADTQRHLQMWFGQYEKHYRYDHIRLLDTQGVTRLSWPAGLPPVAPIVTEHASKAYRSGQVMLQDFYHSADDQKVRMGLLIPIFDESDTNRPLGMLVFRIDPTTYLYPLISRWPVPSKTAETLLVRGEGNEAVFLNELRFQTNTALNLRISLTNTNMPAVKAVLRQEGVVEGRDYRGVPVLAALHAIPDSPWFMVARRDLAEVYAPLRAQLSQVIVMIGILLFGAGAGVGLVWRQQRVRFYRERAQSAEVLQRSQSLLTQAEEMGKVGGWEFDIETQQQTWTKTVYDIHELDVTGRPTVDQGVNYYTPASRPIIERAVQRAIEQGEPFDLELEIITAKGNLRSVQAVGRADLARRKISGFFQDITSRKQAEQSLLQSRRAALNMMADAVEARDRSEQLNKALRLKNLVFDASMAANSIADLNGVITEVNEAFVRVWGFSSKDEVVGKPIPYFLNDQNEAVGIITALNNTGHWEGDYTGKKKDGSTCIVNGLATTIKPARERPLQHS